MSFNGGVGFDEMITDIGGRKARPRLEIPVGERREQGRFCWTSQSGVQVFDHVTDRTCGDALVTVMCCTWAWWWN